jgi:hypothetical protein
MMPLLEQHSTEDLPNNHKERRKFTRFTPKDGTMAVNSHALGPVVDISMGGLSFRYTDDKKEDPMTDLFGIFLGSDNILIDRIQSQIVSDKVTTQGTSFLQTRSRQRSIQFVRLTTDQQKDLESFILTKTQGVSQEAL